MVLHLHQKTVHLCLLIVESFLILLSAESCLPYFTFTFLSRTKFSTWDCSHSHWRNETLLRASSSLHEGFSRDEQWSVIMACERKTRTDWSVKAWSFPIGRKLNCREDHLCVSGNGGGQKMALQNPLVVGWNKFLYQNHRIRGLPPFQSHPNPGYCCLYIPTNSYPIVPWISPLVSIKIPSSQGPGDRSDRMPCWSHGKSRCGHNWRWTRLDPGSEISPVVDIYLWAIYIYRERERDKERERYIIIYIDR